LLNAMRTKIGYVLGAELCHQMGAMGFKSTRADSQPMPALLVGAATGDQGRTSCSLGVNDYWPT
jgi:hypothetical protein